MQPNSPAPDNTNPNPDQQPPAAPTPAPAQPPAGSPPTQPAAEQPPEAPPAQPGDSPAPPQGPMPQGMARVGEHQLTDGETILFAEIYQSFDKLKAITAKFLCAKHGYPEDEPVAFEFNWQNRTVVAYRPSNIEVAKNASTAPAPGQAR